VRLGRLVVPSRNLCSQGCLVATSGQLSHQGAQLLACAAHDRRTMAGQRMSKSSSAMRRKEAMAWSMVSGEHFGGRSQPVATVADGVAADQQPLGREVQGNRSGEWPGT